MGLAVETVGVTFTTFVKLAVGAMGVGDERLGNGSVRVGVGRVAISVVGMALGAEIKLQAPSRITTKPSRNINLTSSFFTTITL